jgi:hypothetical protein
VSRTSKFIVGAAIVGVAGLVAIVLVERARYLTGEDLLGSPAPPSAECTWYGSTCTVSIPKADLASCSGPIRQFVEGKERVVVNDYVLDKAAPEDDGAAGSKLPYYRSYGSQFRGVVLVMIHEEVGTVHVSVAHQAFGVWGRIQNLLNKR